MAKIAKEPEVLKIHPRHVLLSKAQAEFGTFLSELRKKHKLSQIEMLDILVQEVRYMSGCFVKWEREDRESEGK